MSLKAWKDLYPDAEVIGPRGLEGKIPNLKFDFQFNPNKLERTFGNNEIIAHYFPGHATNELAFLHVPSKTMFIADLAENLPAKEAFSLTGENPASGFSTALFTKIFSPNNWIHNFVLAYGTTKDKVYISFKSQALMLVQ